MPHCHPSNCDLLIFDLDGTLIDSFPDIRRSLHIGFDAISAELEEKHLDLIRKGVGLNVFYEHIVGPVSDDPDRFKALVASYREDYNTHSINKPYPFAADVLSALRKERSNMRLAIATTKPTTMAKWVLEHCGLDCYFHVIRGTDDLPHKPDPALLHEVCRLAECDPSKSMMVGDTDRDIGAAQAAPMASIAICHGGWSRPDLESLRPTHLVSDLRELRTLFLT